MKVYINRKQQKMLKNADKCFGILKAKKIRQRLNELNNASTLLDIGNLKYPGLHKLTGQMNGQLALTTKHPFRLIIKPRNEEYNLNDYSSITQVEVLELDKDYH